VVYEWPIDERRRGFIKPVQKCGLSRDICTPDRRPIACGIRVHKSPATAAAAARRSRYGRGPTTIAHVLRARCVTFFTAFEVVVYPTHNNNNNNVRFIRSGQGYTPSSCTAGVNVRSEVTSMCIVGIILLLYCYYAIRTILLLYIYIYIYKSINI